MDIFFTANVMLAYSIYFLGVASPGPSNLAIMGAAMASGRKSALILSLGILCGSCFWGVLAAFGLSAVLANYSTILYVMKIMAACYLLWLAYKSLRSALKAVSFTVKESNSICLKEKTYKKLFFSGLLLHLTNPKAIFVWLSIVTFAMQDHSQRQIAFSVVLGCALIGLCVFFGYALIFSTRVARQAYIKLRVWLESILAIFFTFSAFRMLASNLK